MIDDTIRDMYGNELNIGDIITLHENYSGEYEYTDERGEYEIIDMSPLSSEDVLVKIINHVTANLIGDTYWVHAEWFYKVSESSDEDVVVSSQIRICDGCGKELHEEGYRSDEKIYCLKCYRFEQGLQRWGYHSYNPTLNFLKTEEDVEEKYKTIYMGREWETEPKNFMDNERGMLPTIKKVLRVFNTPDFEQVYSSSDSSLRNCGSEFVFHPMTLNYVYTLEEKLKEAGNILVDDNWQSHDGGSCGMHIHVSRNAFGNTEAEIEKNITKLIMFTEFYQKELIQFSRRDRNRMNYCTPLSSCCSNRFEGKYGEYKKYNTEYIGKLKDRYRSSHSMLVNLQHADTVEIRVFRGSLNYKTIIATYEFVNNLVRVIRENPISQIYWDKVINYGETKYLKEYCEKRRIEPNGKHMKDYAKKYKKILEDIKNNNDTLKEEISSEIRSISEELQDMLQITIPSDRDREYLQDIIDRLSSLNELWDYLNRGVRESDYNTIVRYLIRLGRGTITSDKIDKLSDKVKTYNDNKRELEDDYY